MREVLLRVGILEVKIGGEQIALSVILLHIVRPHLPRALVLFPFVPPRQTIRELLKLNRRGLRVVLAPDGLRLFVIPNRFGWMRAVKEQQIGWDARVWCK